MARQTSGNVDNDATWLNAKDAVFGLEMQLPWSRHLLEGRKSVEVRSYNLPPQLLGTKLYILESQPGTDGVSALGDQIKLHHNVKIRGWCLFDAVKEYTTQSDFEVDEGRHLVSPTSGYAWKEGSTQVLYGWIAKEYELIGDNTQITNHEASHYKTAVRRKRSIFQLYKEDL
ncbi:expressed unknown protein [Seminavis robusta]|uniref:ASCH domain-containing protein n=1 Tax=Seminavis robusta TaxID=568900 RepID=A0A9N8DL51_9STRA|nr:expressed unknown protein [Seminavis robusta]|eukprot:Sro139_g065250.1 n/a (172) ;mRNA; f:100637-101152